MLKRGRQTQTRTDQTTQPPRRRGYNCAPVMCAVAAHWYATQAKAHKCAHHPASHNASTVTKAHHDGMRLDPAPSPTGVRSADNTSAEYNEADHTGGQDTTDAMFGKQQSDQITTSAVPRYPAKPCHCSMPHVHNPPRACVVAAILHAASAKQFTRCRCCWLHDTNHKRPLGHPHTSSRPFSRNPLPPGHCHHRVQGIRNHGQLYPPQHHDHRLCVHCFECTPHAGRITLAQHMQPDKCSPQAVIETKACKDRAHQLLSLR